MVADCSYIACLVQIPRLPGHTPWSLVHTINLSSRRLAASRAAITRPTGQRERAELVVRSAGHEPRVAVAGQVVVHEATDFGHRRLQVRVLGQHSWEIDAIEQLARARKRDEQRPRLVAHWNCVFGDPMARGIANRSIEVGVVALTGGDLLGVFHHFVRTGNSRRPPTAAALSTLIGECEPNARPLSQ